MSDPRSRPNTQYTPPYNPYGSLPAAPEPQQQQQQPPPQMQFMQYPAPMGNYPHQYPQMMDPQLLAYQHQQYLMQQASQNAYFNFQQQPMPHISQHQYQAPIQNQQQQPPRQLSSAGPKKKLVYQNQQFVPSKQHHQYLQNNTAPPPPPQQQQPVNGFSDNHQQKQQHLESPISSTGPASPDQNIANTTSASSPPSVSSTPKAPQASSININHNNHTQEPENSHNNNNHLNNSIKIEESSPLLFFKPGPVEYEVGKPIFFGTNEAQLNSQKQKFREIDEAKKEQQEKEDYELSLSQGTVESGLKDLTLSNKIGIIDTATTDLRTPSPEIRKPTPVLTPSWSRIAEQAAKKNSPKSSNTTSINASPINKKDEKFVPSISNVLEPQGVIVLRSMLDKNFQKQFVSSSKLPVIIPRGLVNTGNICFMSSILQLLLYCQPFYENLHAISTRTLQNLGSEESTTPIVDAMIELFKNFNIQKSEKKKYGDPFAPEQFHKQISKTSNFVHLKWGQQEDAEEFLGYLLDGLHEEFISSVNALDQLKIKNLLDSIVNDETRQLIISTLKQFSNDEDLKSSNESNGNSIVSEDGWQEVGAGKKKISAKRTVEVKPSPIRQLFGGQFRSVLDSPKLRETSITLDPFQQVQLDISDDSINTLEDAFLHLSQAEEISFKLDDGTDCVAKKQTSLNKLPQVMIVHLKRFSYVNKVQEDGYQRNGRIEKIRKKISYQHEFSIPKELISKTELHSEMNLKYKLTGVVYHHGINSEGGHYTVDVLRSDKSEWIRIDDTSIEELKPEEVLNGGDNNDVKTAYILMYQKI